MISRRRADLQAGGSNFLANFELEVSRRLLPGDGHEYV